MKLLNIETSESDYQIMLEHLKNGGITDIYSEKIETPDQLRAALKKESWDLIISDYKTINLEIQVAVTIAAETSVYIPFIVLSNHIGEDMVADMMKAGIEDFISKSSLERIVPVVKRIMREAEVRRQGVKSRAVAKKALQAKEEMLAVVYHDIKNPLSAIMLDVQMLELLSHNTPDEGMVEDIQIQSRRILKTVERLKNLVSELVENYTPLEDADFESHLVIRKAYYNPLHILNEVLDSYKPLIQDKNLSIKKIVTQRKMIASFDKDRIFQVLSNLMNNALKFSTYGSEIIMELEEKENGDNVFSISDSGPGISEKNLPHIFDKNWTGGSGSGRGLFTCKNIIESHEGVIKAEVAPTGGAKFWFKIPAGNDLPQDFFHSDESLKKTSSPDQHNIYIIDDDEDLREVMTWAVEKEGYRVFSYGNAKTALEDLNLTAYPPTLIVLDFHMDKMNGKEFLELKKTSKHYNIKTCPVVMVSAAPKVVREAIDPALYSEVLLKPLNLGKLTSTIHKYIRSN